MFFICQHILKCQSVFTIHGRRETTVNSLNYLTLKFSLQGWFPEAAPEIVLISSEFTIDQVLCE